MATWLALIAGAAGCGTDDSIPVMPEEFELPADQVILDVTHYMTTNGIRRAKLVADTGYVYEDSAVIEFRRPRLTLFGESGRETAEIVAERGTLHSQTQVMTARGSVVLTTREGGRRIETEELHFDPATDRIWSDVATMLQEPGSTVYGDGFTSDGRLNIRVRNPRGRMGGVRIEF